MKTLEKVLILLLLIGMAACAHGNLQPEPRVTDANSKIVGVVWPSIHTIPMSPDAWRASPWWREGEVVTPSRVVISADKYACILRDGDVRDPLPMQPFQCADAWRYPRSR